MAVARCRSNETFASSIGKACLDAVRAGIAAGQEMVRRRDVLRFPTIHVFYIIGFESYNITKFREVLHPVRSHLGHVDGRRVVMGCRQAVGIDEIRMGSSHFDRFLVHLFRIAGDRTP